MSSPLLPSGLGCSFSSFLRWEIMSLVLILSISSIKVKKFFFSVTTLAISLKFCDVAFSFSFSSK